MRMSKERESGIRADVVKWTDPHVDHYLCPAHIHDYAELLAEIDALRAVEAALRVCCEQAVERASTLTPRPSSDRAHAAARLAEEVLEILRYDSLRAKGGEHG